MERLLARVWFPEAEESWYLGLTSKHWMHLEGWRVEAGWNAYTDCPREEGGAVKERLLCQSHLR